MRSQKILKKETQRMLTVMHLWKHMELKITSQCLVLPSNWMALSLWWDVDEWMQASNKQAIDDLVKMCPTFSFQAACVDGNSKDTNEATHFWQRACSVAIMSIFVSIFVRLHIVICSCFSIHVMRQHKMRTNYRMLMYKYGAYQHCDI